MRSKLRRLNHDFTVAYLPPHRHIDNVMNSTSTITEFGEFLRSNFYTQSPLTTKSRLGQDLASSSTNSVCQP
jgi:hypothetical protein